MSESLEESLRFWLCFGKRQCQGSHLFFQKFQIILQIGQLYIILPCRMLRKCSSLNSLPKFCR
jgi:hypothetical protein